MDAAIWSGGSQRFELQLHISRPNHHELNCTVCSLSTDTNWAFCQSKARHPCTSIATQTYYGLSTGTNHHPFELGGPAHLLALYSCSQWLTWFIQVQSDGTEWHQAQARDTFAQHNLSQKCENIQFLPTGPCFFI